MKKTKIIIPAMGLLLLSTAASITGTVAWFAVNTSVTVEGLNVRAKAEGGIVIAPYTYTPSAVTNEGANKTDSAYAAPAANTFGASANVALSAADLYPTSTNNVTNWWHAGSASADNHQASTAYTDLTGQTTWESDGKLITGNGSSELYKVAGQYFQYSRFRVKSTTTVDTYSLYLRSLTVSADQNSAAMNKSLRVAFRVGAVTTFVAPKYTAAPESPAEPLKWYTGSAVADATLSYGLAPNVLISAANAVVGNNGQTDPSYVSAGVDLEIWVYYEGEDPNCKTINTEGISMDSLALSFTFATTAA